MSDTRDPNEGKRPAVPPAATLATIAIRLQFVERCTVRNPGDAGEQIRELARLLSGVVEHVQRIDREREDKP